MINALPFDVNTTLILSGFAIIALLQIAIAWQGNRKVAQQLALLTAQQSKAVTPIRNDINALQRDLDAAAKTVTDVLHHKAEADSAIKTQKAVEQAISLASIGVSAENIKRETGLPDDEIAAIVRFHAKTGATAEDTILRAVRNAGPSPRTH